MKFKELSKEKITELNLTIKEMLANGISEEETKKYAVEEIEKFANELLKDKSIDIKKEVEEELKSYKRTGNMLEDFILYMMLI